MKKFERIGWLRFDQVSTPQSGGPKGQSLVLTQSNLTQLSQLLTMPSKKVVIFLLQVFLQCRTFFNRSFCTFGLFTWNLSTYEAPYFSVGDLRVKFQTLLIQLNCLRQMHKDSLEFWRDFVNPLIQFFDKNVFSTNCQEESRHT